MKKATGSVRTVNFGVASSVPVIKVCGCTMKTAQKPRLGRVTHQFSYRDPATARVLFSRFRYEQPDKKTYRYCPCYAGFATDGLNLWAALLYGAHRVAEKVSAGVERIHLTEGEKDSEAIWKHLHECATTGHQGTIFTTEMAEPFRDFDGEIWVHVDRDHLDPKHEGHDSPGAVAALRKVRALRAVGVQLSRIKLVEAAAGKDAEDHLAEHELGVEDFETLTMPDLKARAPGEGDRSDARTLTKLPSADMPEGPALKRAIAAAMERGLHVTPLGNGTYKMSCPNPDHPDGNPSFEMKQGKAGVVGHCFSRECELKEWAAGLGLREADLFDTSKADEETSNRFKLVGPAELAAPVPPMRWMVKGVWPENSHGPLGGEKKTLKTYHLLSMAIAVASGEPMFGTFHVEKAAPVLMYVGEGGQIPTRRRLQRMCAAYGVALKDLPLYMVFDAGALDSIDFLTTLHQNTDQVQPGLVIVDPLYAYHPSGIEAQNLYERGRMLAGLSRAVSHDCSLIVADHFRKNSNSELDLSSIAQAGMGEWADSWILQQHREEAQVDAGSFRLKVEYGSRQWGGRQWAVDWEMGAFDDDSGEHVGNLGWSVGPLNYSKRRSSTAREETKGRAKDSMAARILELLRDEPLTYTKEKGQRVIREEFGKDTGLVRQAWDELYASGAIRKEKGRVWEGEGAQRCQRTRDVWKVGTSTPLRLSERS
ncbi:AAA family ATPase [Streptomyces cinereoruber]|uniref:AAA family ATPase n=1 Tax=Streptomyces cinereoruber TaxID=67260 RepID=UPI00362852D9